MNHKFSEKVGLTRWSSNSNLVFNQAILDGDVTKVKFLLKYCSQNLSLNDLNNRGMTPLQQSCCNSNLQIVTLLLDHGADMEKADDEGQTALHMAVMANSIKIAKFLIDSCANLTAMDSKGRFPIDLAVDVKMVVFLAKEMTAQGYEETARMYMEKWGLIAPKPDDDDFEGPLSPVSFYDDNSSDESPSKENKMDFT
ncbi:protein phosphatase 1 regulatory subunit 12C [Exaiptasia diaphana]|uniref:Uncharacterized protein n=1 Tax=Exaiptasia diaphana TaxID=2652724 RepID=A0A913Y1E0_EXADI|nr:protein phosphatase 1 regulatory subunit 12C [Exaiptasia diaphana]KXJ07218.1 Protein phosphatase 1 regulatory subunit 12C [Exaiptasia diaphana]